MYKKLFTGLCVLMIAVLMFGCNNNADSGNPTGTTTTGITTTETPIENTLPDITMFSETEYENYKTHFSPVKSASYRCNGTVEEISADDPRLLRLLNFLAYSSENSMDVWTQGYVSEDEINSCLSTDYPMLEINFYNEKGRSGSAIGDTPKIVVCGDSYLAFVDPALANNGIEGVFAEQYWPYGELVTSTNGTDFRIENWGLKYWLNILEYAGF